MAIPNATLKMRTVDGFRATPAQPIIPAVTSNGIKFGIREQIKILKDLKRKSIQT